MTSLVTVAEVAEHLGLSPRTVYDWVAAGKMPARRIGNVYRFDLDEIDRWIESRRVGPAVPPAAEARA